MRIAVTYEDGEISPRFGLTKEIKLYDIEDGKVVEEWVVGTGGKTQKELVAFLAGHMVDALICDGIGDGVRTMLSEEGVEVYGGVEESADAAVAALLEGNLEFEPYI